MLSGFISVTLLTGYVFAQMDALTNVTTAFSMAQIVPNVIDSFNPVDLLNITFTDSVTMEMVDVVPGILLTMEQTADEPMFILDTSTDSNDSSMGDSFVVVMFDPDAPTPQMPNVSEFLHFLGGDFTADSTTGLLSNSSPALMEFFSPTPPPGSDPHRYVLLVFDQPSDFDTNGPMFVNSTTPRTNFSVTDFAQQTNLGMPIAGNFFLVGPDNSTTPISTSSVSGSSATATDTSIQTPSGSLLPLPNPTPSTTTATVPSTTSAPALTTTPATTTMPMTSHALPVEVYQYSAAGMAVIAVLTAVMSCLL